MAENDGKAPGQQPPAQAPAKRQKILIINHTGSVHRIPIQSMAESDDDRPTLLHTITLLPGANAVDPKHWDAVKGYDVLKILVRKRHRGGIEVGDPRIDVSTLAAFTDVEEAKELIEETVDGDLLKAWLRSEKRTDLVKLLEVQLEKIDPHNDLGKSEGEDEVKVG